MALLDVIKELPKSLGGSLQSFGKGALSGLTFGLLDDKINQTGLSSLKSYESDLASGAGQAASFLVGGVGGASTKVGTKVLSKTDDLLSSIFKGKQTRPPKLNLKPTSQTPTKPFRPGPGTTSTGLGGTAAGTAAGIGATAGMLSSGASYGAPSSGSTGPIIPSGYDSGLSNTVDSLKNGGPTYTPPGSNGAPGSSGSSGSSSSGTRPSSAGLTEAERTWRPDIPIGTDPITGQIIYTPAQRAQAGGAGSTARRELPPPPLSGSFGGGGSSHLGAGTTGPSAGSSPIAFGIDDEETVRDLNAGQIKVPGADTPLDISVFDSATQQQIKKFLTTPEALSADDLGQLKNTLTTQAQKYAEALMKKNALPRDNMGNPIGVEETPSQGDWIENAVPLPDRSNIRAEMDAVRQQAGQPALIEQRNQIMADLQAAREIFTKAIDDIKANPDLPKGLAARRIADLMDSQKLTIDSLMAQLDQTLTQLDDIDELVDQEFNIIKAENAQEEELFDRRMKMFDFYVESNAIGGLKDSEISGFAQQYGVSESIVRNIRDAALEPNVRIEGNARDGFYKVTEARGKEPTVTRLAGGTQTDSSSNKLSALDIKRLQEQSPGAGIIFGDTASSAEKKIQQSMRDSALSDLGEDIGAGFRNFSELARAYPELTAVDITNALIGAGVNQTIDPTLEETQSGIGGFFSTLFKR